MKVKVISNQCSVISRQWTVISGYVRAHLTWESLYGAIFLILLSPTFVVSFVARALWCGIFAGWGYGSKLLK